MAYVDKYDVTESDPLMGGVSDYIALLKPRVMALVIFTALIAMIIADGFLHPGLSAIALLCISVGAGASGALNMWYDADIDAVMSRTSTRPIPSGKISSAETLSFGLVLSVFSVAILGLVANWLAAGLLAFTIFFYAVIYTMWLKRFTAQNIVIGGAAGALPPVIGWAAVTGSVGLEALSLFLLIFMWTPPHFWALALVKNEDYKRANIPMLPVTSGEKNTKIQILIYTILLLPTAMLPSILGFAGPFYALIAFGFSLYLCFLAYTLSKAKSDETKPAMKLFGWSIVYLFSLFMALAIDYVVNPFSSMGIL